MPQRVPALAARRAPCARPGLRLGGPDDACEREADRVADRVAGAVAGGEARITGAVARAGPASLAPAPGSYFEPRADAQARAPNPALSPAPDPAMNPALIPITAALPAGAGPVVQRWPAGPDSGPLLPWPAKGGRGIPPKLPAVPEVISEDSCGTAPEGTPPEERRRILECEFHARYVNVLNQAAANMSRMQSPYAPGLAALYRALVGEVVRAGAASHPTPDAPRKYSVTDLEVRVSRGVTLPVPLFDLDLVQEMNGINGAHHGRGIELNEVSHAMIQGDHADVERTMYHEGFHYLSWLVGQHNEEVREGLVPGKEISPQLDDALVQGFEGELRAAVEPIWQRALDTLPTRRDDLTPRDLSGFQWSKVIHEALSQLEEVIYADLQAGWRFLPGDLPAWRQDWLREPGYWDAGIVFETSLLQRFLEGEASAEIDARMLPVVQRIQLVYLEQRPRR